MAIVLIISGTVWTAIFPWVLGNHEFCIQSRKSSLEALVESRGCPGNGRILRTM
jgi:hypothetical protein